MTKNSRRKQISRDEKQSVSGLCAILWGLRLNIPWLSGHFCERQEERQMSRCRHVQTFDVGTQHCHLQSSPLNTIAKVPELCFTFMTARYSTTFLVIGMYNHIPSYTGHVQPMVQSWPHLVGFPFKIACCPRTSMCVSGRRAGLRGNLASCSVVSSSVCAETQVSDGWPWASNQLFFRRNKLIFLPLSQEPFATNGEES